MHNSAAGEQQPAAADGPAVLAFTSSLSFSAEAGRGGGGGHVVER